MIKQAAPEATSTKRNLAASSLENSPPAAERITEDSWGVKSDLTAIYEPIV
jgi:hypothetical protein